MLRRKPTIREVAQHANVSATTVSHVINNTRFVSDALCHRVHLAMDELGYQPNALARSLRRGQTHTLGLILPDSANPFFAEIGRNIEDCAFEQGYSLILCNTEGNLDREHIYVELLSQKRVDGIIIIAAGDHAHSLNTLLEFKLPLVLVDRDLPGVHVDTVLVDNHEGGYLATRHLIDHGHRCIGCIAGPSHLLASAQRVAGYYDALVEAGLPVKEDLIRRGDFHPESGLLALAEFLELPEPPTAIFACNDLMAIGALRAADASGLRVPGDLALIGFDDIELATYTTPPLSTISQPKKELGQLAVQMLLDRIQRYSGGFRYELLRPRFITRKSCGDHTY
jgi:LacI family transcriptional regulator